MPATATQSDEGVQTCRYFADLLLQLDVFPHGVSSGFFCLVPGGSGSFRGSPRDQLRAGPGVVPELFLRLKPGKHSPYTHPAQSEHGSLSTGKPQKPADAKGGQKPDPAEYVAKQGAFLGDRRTTLVDHPDIPGFHGQGLAFCPKPHKVDAKNHEQECLQGMTIVESIAGLAQGAEKIAGYEDNAEHQQAFVNPAGHSPGQGWYGQCIHAILVSGYSGSGCRFLAACCARRT